MAKAQRLLGEEIYHGVVARGFSDVRFAHGHVMAPLQLRDGLRLTDLAATAAMTPQSMNELVDDLATKGYIERRPDPVDRRAKRIYLTERGNASAKAGWMAAAETEAHLGRILGQKGRGQLRRALLKVIAESGTGSRRPAGSRDNAQQRG